MRFVMRKSEMRSEPKKACSIIISHLDPKKHFENYTPLERGICCLSKDTNIIFLVQISSELCPNTYRMSRKHVVEKKKALLQLVWNPETAHISQFSYQLHKTHIRKPQMLYITM